MKIVADLHLHSKYSRATSKYNTINNLAIWAIKKGINLLGTGDFTHPKWLEEIEENLIEDNGSGLYKLKKQSSNLRYMLTTEISLIWSQDKRVRRIHLLIWSNNLDKVKSIKDMLKKFGKIDSDGRPIFGMSAYEAVSRIKEIDSQAVFVPAHIWTPWFAVFGSKSGFDSLEECFRDLHREIYAVETGLSSDPLMNWRISDLNSRALVSFGDAHSASNLMREATVFELNNLTFNEIVTAIKNSSPNKVVTLKPDNPRIDWTLEFFPQEGKYHMDGHRVCQVMLSPNQTKKLNGICPRCKKKITVGVLSRINDLSDQTVIRKYVAYKCVIPLARVISEGFKVGEKSKKVQDEYEKLVKLPNNEFEILINTSLSRLGRITHPLIVEGIGKMREGKVSIYPGYDGEYGKVNL